MPAQSQSAFPPAGSTPGIEPAPPPYSACVPPQPQPLPGGGQFHTEPNPSTPRPSMWNLGLPTAGGMLSPPAPNGSPSGRAGGGITESIGSFLRSVVTAPFSGTYSAPPGESEEGRLRPGPSFVGGKQPAPTTPSSAVWPENIGCEPCAVGLSSPVPPHGGSAAAPVARGEAKALAENTADRAAETFGDFDCDGGSGGSFAGREGNGPAPVARAPPAPQLSPSLQPPPFKAATLSAAMGGSPATGAFTAEIRAGGASRLNDLSPPPAYGGSTAPDPRQQAFAGAAVNEAAHAPLKVAILESSHDPDGGYDDFRVAGWIVGAPGAPAGETRFFKEQPLSPHSLPRSPEGEAWRQAWQQHLSKRAVHGVITPPRAVVTQPRAVEAPRGQPAAPPSVPVSSVLPPPPAEYERVSSSTPPVEINHLRARSDARPPPAFFVGDGLGSDPALPRGTAALSRANGTIFFAHTQLDFFAAEGKGGLQAPVGGFLPGAALQVFTQYGIGSERDAKTFDKALQSGELWRGFEDGLKQSRDPTKYQWARRTLCEQLVKGVSAHGDPTHAWVAVVSSMRAFLGSVADAAGKYRFLNTFLRSEDSIRDEGCPFSRLLIGLDRKFALGSGHETKELYLEQARAARISPTMLLSDVAREKAHNLELAGAFTECGLVDEVRTACSDSIRALPEGELRSLLRTLDVEIDKLHLGSSNNARHDLDILILKYDEFERSPWGRRAWEAHWSSAPPPARAPAPPARPAAGSRPEGVGRGAFPIDWSVDADPSPSTPPCSPGDGPQLYPAYSAPTRGGGGIFLNKAGVFDEEFVQKEDMDMALPPPTAVRTPHTREEETSGG